jgi:hypothetical protein
MLVGDICESEFEMSESNLKKSESFKPGELQSR